MYWKNDNTPDENRYQFHKLHYEEIEISIRVSNVDFSMIYYW